MIGHPRPLAQRRGRQFQGCYRHMQRQTAVELGLLLYPGVQLAAVHGLTDLFEIASRGETDRDAKGPRLRISHWRLEDGDGTPRRVYDSLPHAGGTPSVLILPPSLKEPISAAAAAIYRDWLRQQHRAGVRLASICAGAFLLGETGLLAGRTATTHWRHAERFGARFPEVRLDTDQLIVEGDDLITAGGLMAWTDLGLRLVDLYLGAARMLDTARVLVVDPPGRQQRFYSAFVPRLNHGDGAVLGVQQWLQETGAQDSALESLVRRAGLEERTFLRRFRKATGMTTTAYCQQVRVGRARELLQASRLPLERVAWEVGYSDPSAFRKVFTRIVGLSPGDYRRRFSAASLG